MALSEPRRREHVHARSLEIKGYRRDDALWDIEGHLIDVKPAAVDPGDGARRPGEPIHEMWLRLTIDDDMLVHHAEAATDHSPFRVCPDAAPNFSKLAGIRIGPGWTRAVRQRVGGVHGCTHLVEMLGQMATTAMQTMWNARMAKRKVDAAGEPVPPSGLMNSCHAYNTAGPVVRELYPSRYTGDAD